MALAIAGLATIVIIGGVLARSSSAGATSVTRITVERATTGRTIPAGFVGISLEYPDLETYAGARSKDVNPVFIHLIGNLAAGRPPSLRLGGDTTDWTWWPIRGKRRPSGVRYTLTPRWLRVLNALTQATGAKVLLGINLEANSRRVAAAEADAFVRGLGVKAIEGLEVGNEPELYDSFPWYIVNLTRVYGRPAGYTFGDFMHDFRVVSHALGDVPIAGPNIGGPEWMPHLPRFLGGDGNVRVATLHRYPLKHCRSVAHNSVSDLLANSSSRGLANGLATYARTAHAHHVPLRIDEMNAVSCGGETGVSNTFASALWSLDALFELARVGVDGVNIHTRPGSPGELFQVSKSHGRWRARVNPEYYGLMMFSQAAPPGSQMLRTAGSQSGSLHIWATRGSDGQIRVVMINKSLTGRQTVRIRVPTTSQPGALERLEAPSAHATGHVSLGGHSFGSSTTTGTLPGSSSSQLRPKNGVYLVRLPPASAALLTLP